MMDKITCLAYTRKGDDTEPVEGTKGFDDRVGSMFRRVQNRKSRLFRRLAGCLRWR